MATYRVPVLEDFSWQPPVKDKDLFDAPGAPSKGDRYIVASGTSSGDDWFGYTNDITYYDGVNWQFDTPSEGWRCWLDDEDAYYYFDGTDWQIDDTSALESSIDSLEIVASAAISSIDSLESEISTNLLGGDASIDSLEIVASAAISSIDSLETVASAAISSIDSLESEISVNKSLDADSIDSLETSKQDKGTYVSAYGAIEFTV